AGPAPPRRKERRANLRRRVTPLQRKSPRKTDEDRLLAPAAATAAVAVGVEGEGVRGGEAGEDDVCVSYSRFLLIFSSCVPFRVPQVLTIFANDGSLSVKHDSEVVEHQQLYHHYQQPRISKNAPNTSIFKPIIKINKRVTTNASE
uniref:hypothetical protein n=1 Tax=Salmonella sp. s55033 TaxID=3159676 RepID=UPI0039815D2D